ncbi:hypothetical protein, partial [Streptomyces sp. NPDC020298]|uniref:hypothetical protein n=1 Tax=unclassified Streptomyces TaxID=2593676 RepID=UPI0033E5DCC6
MNGSARDARSHHHSWKACIYALLGARTALAGLSLEVISFGRVVMLWAVVGIVERLVPDELWELF